MTDKIYKIVGLCSKLKSSINQGLPDIQLVYKIRGNTSLFSPDISKTVDRIIAKFDDYAENAAFQGKAISEMTRLLGLMEGVLEDERYKVEQEKEQQLAIENKTELQDFVPTFSLNAKDKDRVLELCADMRKIILATVEFDNAHKVRLSNRIFSIEAEVHKKKGLFDVVLGGVSDIGETLGKFGKDIKPLTDRMAEVKKITRKNTQAYDQIPAPEEIKRLPKPDEEGYEEEE